MREFQNIDLDTMARKLEVVRGGCRGGVICGHASTVFI